MTARGRTRGAAFYGGLLGLPEVERPAALASRGGAWFRAGTIGLHVGVQEPFAASTTAHPALRVAEVAALHRIVEALEDAGHDVVWADVPLATARCKVHDPFGNLVELLVGSTG